MAFYRITVGDIGIYEAVDRDCSKDDPRRLNKPDGSWLVKIGMNYPGAVSYWTEKGYQQYKNSGLYDWHASVIKGSATVEILEEKPHQVLYEDEHQIIVPSIV